MKVQYYRIFVEKTRQLSLFDAHNSKKQDLIYEAFNVRKPLYFKAGKQRLVFLTKVEVGPYILGTLAKAAHVNVQKSPEEGFVTESIESWPHVPVIINTDPNPKTGQSIIIGWNRAVFENPLFQLRILARELTRTSILDKGYEMAINTITDRGDFWRHIKDYRGHINSLTFSFEAPNLFGTKDALNDELRDAQDSFGITRAQVSLENSAGELNVPEDNQFVNESLKYISDGGGSYKIKLKNKRSISSREATKAASLEDIEFEIATNDRKAFEKLCDKLFLWLDRSE